MMHYSCVYALPNTIKLNFKTNTFCFQPSEYGKVIDGFLFVYSPGINLSNTIGKTIRTPGHKFNPSSTSETISGS